MRSKREEVGNRSRSWRVSRARDEGEKSGVTSARHYDLDDPEDQHYRAGQARDHDASAADLLDQNETGQHGHPHEVHHTDDEEDAHESPAAPEAIRAVTQAHLERARLPVTPVRHQESQR